MSALAISLPRARGGSVRLQLVPLLSAVVVAVFALAALVGSRLAPYDAAAMQLDARLLPPLGMAGGVAGHVLGTDDLGRDVLSRLIVGARASFEVALLAVLIGGVAGALLGGITAYTGGKLEALVMRCSNASLAFPIVLFAILLATSVGPGLKPLIFLMTLVLWARFARLVHGQILSVKERPYVVLARVGGSSKWRIMRVHILPSIAGSIAVLFLSQIGIVLILEATLSFLGAGVPAAMPSWGGMIASGRDYIAGAWWLTLFPGAAICLVVLAFNLLGDWLRERLSVSAL